MSDSRIGSLSAVYSQKCRARGLHPTTSYRQRLDTIDLGHSRCFDFSSLHVDDSFDIIIDLLLVCTSVNRVDFSDMNLVDDILEHVAHVLLRCPHIRCIDISSNHQLSDHVGSVLLAMARERSAAAPLAEVYLQGTGMSPSMKKLIRGGMGESIQDARGSSMIEQRSQHNGELSRSHWLGGTLSGAGEDSESLFDESSTVATTVRARFVAQYIFSSLHRALCLLCWEPPSRTGLWLLFYISAIVGGVSVSSVSLAIVLAFSHRRGAELQVERFAWASKHEFGDVRYNWMVRWKEEIQHTILIPLTREDDRSVREGLQAAFSATETLITALRSDTDTRRRIKFWAVCCGMLAMFVPTTAVLLVILIVLFLWAPLGCPLFHRLLVLLQAVSSPRMRGPPTVATAAITDSLSHSSILSFFVEPLQLVVTGERDLGFEPTVALTCGEQTWLAPRLPLGASQWQGDTSSVFSVDLNAAHYNTLTAEVLRLVGGVGGRPPRLVSVARGDAAIDKTLLRGRGTRLTIMLSPVGAEQSVVERLLRAMPGSTTSALSSPGGMALTILVRQPQDHNSVPQITIDAASSSGQSSSSRPPSTAAAHEAPILFASRGSGAVPSPKR